MKDAGTLCRDYGIREDRRLLHPGRPNLGTLKHKNGAMKTINMVCSIILFWIAIYAYYVLGEKVDACFTLLLSLVCDSVVIYCAIQEKEGE